MNDTLIRRKAPVKKELCDSAVDVRNVDWAAEWPKIVEATCAWVAILYLILRVMLLNYFLYKGMYIYI